MIVYGPLNAARIVFDGTDDWSEFVEAIQILIDSGEIDHLGSDAVYLARDMISQGECHLPGEESRADKIMDSLVMGDPDWTEEEAENVV